MAVAQDWCLQCGAGAPGSIDTSGWRSTAATIGASAILALGAAAAAYAALSKGSTHKARVLTATVAQTTTQAATPPATTPKAPAAARTVKPAPPAGTVKPPKIPLTASTPEASTTVSTPETSTTTEPSTTNTTSTGSSGAGAAAESQPAAIVLDTNAASTYNPYSYPASWFGDPSLTIDGDTATGWSAQVDPAVAPRMAEGVLITLRTARKLSALELVTSTPCMTVQVFGAKGHTAPASITDPAWVPLSRSRVVKKRHVRISLRRSKKAFSLVTLWISRAPAASIGTAEAPGQVRVNELELFPAG